MRVRRVVTGHDRNGKAVFASDQEVDPLTLALIPGAEFHRLLGADQAPAFPDDGGPTAQTSYYPPVGGYRFGLFSVPPGTAPVPAGLDRQAALAEMEEKVPACWPTWSRTTRGCTPPTRSTSRWSCRVR